MKKEIGSTFHLPPLGVDLPLFWSAMGEETRRSPSYRWHGLRREQEPRLLWQMTLRGEGMIEIGPQSPQPLHRGEGFLVQIPSDHCYYYRPGSVAWRFVWVIWSGPAVGPIANALMGRTPARLMRMHPDASEMRALRAKIQLGAESAGDPWQNSVEAYRLLLAVCRASAERPARSRRVTRTVAQVEKLLRSEPGSAIGKAGLASRLGLSRFQLYRALKQQMGISPHEWAARQRVIRACQLLKTTRRSVADIAVEAGLPDANYFARFFRQRTGFSPRDWRKLFAGR